MWFSIGNHLCHYSTQGGKWNPSTSNKFEKVFYTLLSKRFMISTIKQL
jgi:hypothetical protein